MTAVPAFGAYVFTVQDAHGDVGVCKIPIQSPDISASPVTLTQLYTQLAALNTALVACINGKVVKQTITLSMNRAQKPNGPLSTYAHVFQRADIHMGDGGLEKTTISLPTPVPTTFLDDGITVNPADTNTAAFIAAVEAHSASKGGSLFNEYLGGRFVEGKPRRRTNLYNSAA